MEPVAQLNAALTGRYDVEREIGAGGMATVYIARDVRHDRRVALKVLKPELGAVLGVERFLAEIRVTANLQHPNLLPLFDSGEANGLLFYVMPFVEGESLRARLDREKQLPVDEAVRIASSVAGALDYAHRHGVIHRDLKPENILLQDGQPLVADFGIALAVSNAGGARITQTGLSLGTPQYMSPEQATGDRVIDGRTDIYSLGAMTYEMLAGEPPHSGTTAQAIIAKLMTDKPRSIRLGREAVPEQVEWAVQHALEKLPADRWATAGQFADALQGKGLTMPAGTAVTVGTRRVAPGWRAHIRNPVVLTLGAVTIAAVAIAGREWTAGRRVAEQPVIRFPLTFPLDLRSFNPRVGSGVAISPDGRTVAFIGAGTGGSTHIFVRSLDDTRPRPVAGTENGRAPFFSPDGRWLGFWANGRLQKADLDGGSVLPLADMPVPNGASWSVKDEIVVSDGSRLSVIPAAGGALRPLSKPGSIPGEQAQLWPVVLPDGEGVVYSSVGSGGVPIAKLAEASLSSGASTMLDLTGTFPLGVVRGVLVYANAANTLLAVPFYDRRRRASGAPIPVATDVVVGADGAAKAAMSASGSLVYLSGPQASQVVVVDSRGGTRPIMTEARAYGYPRFSPDGKRIAITIGSGSHSDVWVYDIASGTPTRLTTEGNQNERPEWTPDGKRIVYRSYRGRRSALWWQPADLSGAAEPLLASDRADFYEGVITPDGRSIVYQLDTLGADVMYRALTGDTTPKAIAATRFSEDHARVSPDGRWVAFRTDESGAQQVVVQPFPGPGARVQVSVSGGTEPVWAPGGRQLFYRDGQRLVAATYTTSPTFGIASRVTLFDDTFVPAPSPHANYDVSPDGTRFLFLKGMEDPQVIVVHNWVAQLLARTAARR